jgi:two-component system, chemotaxis family, chemotaxis protein CheY
MMQTPKIRGKSALIVDDNAQMLRLVQHFLESAGFTDTVVARNGHEGLDQLRRRRFDLVIADWKMPVMDGLTFVTRIRGDTSTDYANIPVIMLTGQSTVNDLKTAVATGINGYVIKPCSPKALLAQVEKVLA